MGRRVRCWGKEAAKSATQNISRVLAFKVGGTATLPPAAPRQFAQSPPATADANRGARNPLTAATAACVTARTQSVAALCGPAHSTFLGNDFFYEIVLNGAMKDAGMAAFGALEDDVTAIRDYLIKRANEDKSGRNETCIEDTARGAHCSSAPAPDMRRTDPRASMPANEERRARRSELAELRAHLQRAALQPALAH
jgi:hypothetical protein